jgi:hypothetical protein
MKKRMKDHSIRFSANSYMAAGNLINKALSRT